MCSCEVCEEERERAGAQLGGGGARHDGAAAAGQGGPGRRQGQPQGRLKTGRAEVR